MTSRSRPSHRRVWLALGACLPILALVWLGYRAIVEWEHAATMVAGKRATAAADLLVAALARDMRGAQVLLLSASDGGPETAASHLDLQDSVVSGLARYQYAAAFFSWQATPRPESVVFYSRSERRPPWRAGSGPASTVPIEVTGEPSLAARLVERVTKDGREGHRFSVFTLALAGSAYQVVAALSYDDPRQAGPPAVLGFLVDLDWVRREYFGDLIAEVGRIESQNHDLAFTIVDEHGQLIGGHASGPGTPAERRQFPLAFFDPLVVAVDPPADLELATWTAGVDASGDTTLAAAGRGARRTMAVAAAMALVLGVALVLSLRTTRAHAALVEMRADFVSAVTHELKTPIANMRAINETLAAGRGAPDMIRDYAKMGSREAARLTRLVDNLLAYARITDVADAYTMSPVALETVVDRCLQEFAPCLTDAGFEVHVDLPEELPPLRGDPTALGLMLNNLVDNAIRYSPTTRHLTLAAHQDRTNVVLSVTDRGLGIPADEIGRVTGRFVRGRNAPAGGSGLGLAIVKRIVTDHHGRLEISGADGVGTTITITLPLAAS